jgi:hypothetical protein
VFPDPKPDVVVFALFPNPPKVDPVVDAPPPKSPPPVAVEPKGLEPKEVVVLLLLPKPPMRINS